MKKNKVTENKPHVSFRSLFSNNKFVLVFSLVIAFGLWLWVSVEKSPVVENVIVSVPVQLDLENSVPSQLGLQVFGKDTYTVDVTVSGKKFIVSTLTADDIKVTAQTNYVDSAGNKSLSLKAVSDSTKDFDITSLSQNYINVYFDTYKEAEYALVPNITTADNSSVVTDGYIMGKVVFSKSAVTVSGPATEVNKITGVNASATIATSLGATTTVTPDIELVGASASELTNVSVDTGDTSITMTIPVLKEVTLPTTITLKNAPASYLAGSLNKTIYPASIKVGISVEKIDQVSEISIGTVDFNDLDAGNNIFYFKTADISDYYVTDSAKSFKVTVNMSDIVSTTLNVPAANILVTKQRNGFTSVVSSKTVQNVRILGPTSVISSLNANDAYAEIDLSNTDLSEGTLTVPVKITIKNNTTCWANGTYSATVTSTVS